MTDKFNFVCIDRRVRDPLTQQTYVYLERGTKVLLPPNVHRVPTLLIINENYRAVVGDEIYGFLEHRIKSAAKRPAIMGQQGGGVSQLGGMSQPNGMGQQGGIMSQLGGISQLGNEPAGYVLGSSAGGVNIVSETFTYYDASPEELLAKGTGSMRQMHNYASVGIHDTLKPIYTPEETYRPNKLSGDVTLDSLQQRRNAELQATIPQLSQNINQAIMPEIAQIKQQISSQPSTTYQPFHYQQSPNTDDAREILFGKGSGWTGGSMDDIPINSPPPNSPYLVNI